MSREIKCFLIEPNGLVKQELRRYRSGAESGCPGPLKYHNGQSRFQTVPADLSDRGSVKLFPEEQVPAKYDPRWPTKCDSCSYVFEENDEWQVFQEVLYRRPGSKEAITLRDAPVGAIWDCAWFPDQSKGPDGKCLCIMTPGGEWMPDLPSSDGTPWTRTGQVPKITVRPSILFPDRPHRPGGYHAFLTDGVLVDC